jgi:hypothetical protein
MAKRKARKNPGTKKGGRRTAKKSHGAKKNSRTKAKKSSRTKAQKSSSAKAVATQELFAMAVLAVLRHRALCKEGDLDSVWRSDIEDARADAHAHQQEHHDHDVRIITQQTSSVRFTG